MTAGGPAAVRLRDGPCRGRGRENRLPCRRDGAPETARGCNDELICVPIASGSTKGVWYAMGKIPPPGG
jgi:hypothetical protein